MTVTLSTFEPETNNTMTALWDGFRVDHGFIRMNNPGLISEGGETDEVILLTDRCNLLSLGGTGPSETIDSMVTPPSIPNAGYEVGCTLPERVVRGDLDIPRAHPPELAEPRPINGTEAREFAFQTSYFSRFLASFPERFLPMVFVGASFRDISDCVLQVVRTMTNPSSPEAQRLIKNSPDVVLYSQQFYLAIAHSRSIEERARRVLLREYQWDSLSRLGGPQKTYEWLHARNGCESQQSRRRRALKGRLSLRKRIVAKGARQGQPTGQGNEVAEVANKTVSQESICAWSESLRSIGGEALQIHP